jgi:hypothetical protein
MWPLSVELNGPATFDARESMYEYSEGRFTYRQTLMYTAP